MVGHYSKLFFFVAGGLIVIILQSYLGTLVELVSMQPSPLLSYSKESSFLAFNQTNPHRHSWCPNATCNNSPICAPCNRRYLFIISTARAGSTTLLQMFNSLPNVRLSGENNGELFIASLLQTNLRAIDQENAVLDDNGTADGAWIHNKIPSQAMGTFYLYLILIYSILTSMCKYSTFPHVRSIYILACPVQHVANTLNPPPAKILHSVNETTKPSIVEYDDSKIFGMKTIRIHLNKTKVLGPTHSIRIHTDWQPEEAADFFKINFPCSRILVNIRSDLTGLANSVTSTNGFEAKGSTLEPNDMFPIIIDRFKKANQFLRSFATIVGTDSGMLLDMNEWSKDISQLNDLLKWMGVSFFTTLKSNLLQ